MQKPSDVALCVGEVNFSSATLGAIEQEMELGCQYSYLVRMMLQGELAISLLEFSVTAVGSDLEGIVILGFLDHCYK